MIPTTLALLGFCLASPVSQKAERLIDTGRPADAAAFLQKSLKKSSKDGEAWWQLARALTARHEGSEPEHPCDKTRAWTYLALNALNQAAALKVRVDTRLATSDLKLSPLKRRGEFQKWQAAQTPPPKNTAALAAFLKTNVSWVTTQGEVMFMDLDTGGTVQRYSPTDDDHGHAEGTWRPTSKASVEIALEEGGIERLQLVPGPFSWQLRGDKQVWEVGPLLHDCEPEKSP
ncbi:MAG: tetratricopeptide repeat protein [Myxococcaceae bacterium]